jgi:hypothetical protein
MFIFYYLELRCLFMVWWLVEHSDNFTVVTNLHLIINLQPSGIFNFCMDKYHRVINLTDCHITINIQSVLICQFIIWLSFSSPSFFCLNQVTSYVHGTASFAGKNICSSIKRISSTSSNKRFLHLSFSIKTFYALLFSLFISTFLGYVIFLSIIFTLFF